MKVKTITCHDVYNSGASLQAYALQTYIAELGHNVEIIDYKPPYLSNHYNFGSISNPKWKRNCLLRCIYLTLKLPGRLCSLKKKRKFDKFRDKYLNLTPKRYNSIEELKSDPPLADLYIAGSDQIWNTFFPNGRDAAFYLDFAPGNAHKISYAASFATESIEDDCFDFVVHQLKNFDSINVRESDAVDIVKKTGFNKNVEWVCDPVFLLDSDHWSSLADESFNEKYILIYDFENNQLIENVAKELAINNGWKIYTVNFKPSYADKSFKNAGPLTFISLIKNSQFVISNSFHGTAFAIIFSKDFYVALRKESINTRMQSLLGYLNLAERFITTEGLSNNNSVDYALVHKLMNKHIEQSKQILNSSLI
ncbi:MAG: polysaccharide pyruvyl transferase family protein [Rikenellaceae bacterium]